MRSVQGIRLTLAGVLALAAAGRAGAEGQDKGFSLHPSIVATTVYDSEPGLGQPGLNASGDVGFWFFPRLEAGYESTEFEVGADVGVDVRRYISTRFLDDQFVHASAFGEVGLLPGLSARLSNAYEPHYKQLGLPENQGSNLIQANLSQAELRYWREVGSGIEMELGGRGSYLLSEGFAASFPGSGGPVVDTGYHADFWQATGFTHLRAPVARQTHALFSGELGFRDYRNGQRADHLNVAVMAGLLSERFEGVELELAAGYGLIDFEGLRDRQQPIGRIELRQRLGPNFRWHALVANGFRSNLVGNEVFEASGEIGFRQQLAEHTDARVDLFVARFEDVGADPDLYGGVEVELGRDLAAQTRVSLAYRYWQNAGDAGANDMHQNAVFLRFSHRH
jgi:hypothetical protein